MASPLAALETGLESLLSSVTYTKQKTGTANVPYIGSSSITPYKHYPIIVLDEINAEHDECKDLTGWEVSIILEIISSTTSNRGSNYDVNQIEAAVDTLMKGGTLSVSGFTVSSTTFDGSGRDESFRVVDNTNPKAKPQRVISRDLSYTIWLTE